MTQGEVGQFWGLSRTAINKSIAGLTAEVKAIVRRARNRGIRAAELMREMERREPDQPAATHEEPRITVT